MDPRRNFGSVAESLLEGLEVCNAGRSGWGPPDLAAYADLRGEMTRAFQEYLREVREGTFPGPEHCYESEEEGEKGG